MLLLKKKYILGWLLAIIVLGVLVHNFYINAVRLEALKNSTVVVGEVESIEHTRGATDVYVQYPYKGATIHNFFSTYDLDVLDSLKTRRYVILKVSKGYPKLYMEFIGISDRDK